MMRAAEKGSVLVGLVGESDNDTRAVQALLGRRYGPQLQFIDLSPTVTGSQLDNPKLQHIVRTNYRFYRPKLVVVSRDLDALATDRAKKLTRLLFFRKLNRGLENRGIFLLHVQAIEALIIADIEPFNRRYQYECAVPDDPASVKDPADFLKKAAPANKQVYAEGHCAALLSEASYEILLAKCAYFERFDSDFGRLSGLAYQAT